MAESFCSASQKKTTLQQNEMNSSFQVDFIS